MAIFLSGPKGIIPVFSNIFFLFIYSFILARAQMYFYSNLSIHKLVHFALARVAGKANHLDLVSITS